MKARDYFPLGKAVGKAFCNRVEETKWLTDNIQACKHSLLIAPRRFGKSSLAEKAIKLSAFPTININFNTCTDENDIELLIRKTVSKLISRSLGPADKIMHLIKENVGNLVPRVVLGTGQAHLELTIKEKHLFAESVEDVLNFLEKILAKQKLQAVMLFDEFQTVGLIAEGKGVEAAIRNAAQNMQHLTIIFSGSNRGLLSSMFEVEARPLYKLCRKLYLKRIEKEHYREHLNKAAQLVWNTDLDENVFEQIMQFSEQHPYYVNYLCDVIWTRCAKAPDIQDIHEAWQLVLDEEESDANAEITQLALGQRKVLRYIALYSGENLMSAENAQNIGMALSSISGAITGLLDKDIIEWQDEKYCIINPIVKWVMKRNR